MKYISIKKKTSDYTDCNDRLHRLYKEEGSALIIAMIMLVVLTIIGTATINTSVTEIMVAGNYKVMKDAFYNTEGPIEYAIKQAEIPKLISQMPGADGSPGSIGASVAIPLAGDCCTTSPILGKNVLANIITGTVTLRRISKPPTLSGTDSKDNDGGFKYYYYVIDVTGRGPANAESHQISEIPVPQPKT